MPNRPNIKVVDLFCGIGGLSHGFFLEGFNVIAGLDIDDTCKYAYETNNSAKFICEDITHVSAGDLNSLYGECDIKVLIGCAPCQPFSALTNKNKTKDRSKWALLDEFGRLIQEVKPDIVSMENVPQLLNFRQEHIFEKFLDVLRNERYYFYYNVVNCQNHGVPQNRKRLVLLASKLGEIQLINNNLDGETLSTVRQAIGHLPHLEHGQTDPNDLLHFARRLSKTNLERIKLTPEGGSWKHWPEDLRLKCHQKKSGKSYSSVYGRMMWDQPSPTITTQCIGFGNGRFGHPSQDRGISLREAAILQSFPASYRFINSSGKFSTTKVARHLGNAVPVNLGRSIAKSIKKHIILHQNEIFDSN